MPDQIYIGNISKGFKTNPLPFNIDNDAFPTLFNFYSWRQRVKRKRGTVFLGQLELQEEISSMPNAWQLAEFSLVSGAGNLISNYSLGSTATLSAGTINLVVASDQTYTDPNEDGLLVGNSGGTGTINYATGDFVAGSTSNAVTGTFSYFPGLPVMGLEDLSITPATSTFPLLLAFDTRKSYQINQSVTPVFFYDVSFYKNSENPVTWSGSDYQQFWTTNYSAALWATNNVPGMPCAWVHACGNQTSATINMTIYDSTDSTPLQTLVVNDYLFFNEGTASTTWTINGQTGYVSAIVNATLGEYTITFPTSQTVNTYNTDTCFIQLLTSSASGTGDGIKWYDGDPTGATGLPTATGTGWVNFSPPLTATSVSIDNVSSGLYYLVGALAILPFKDRILFFGPYIQTSAMAKSNITPIQLQDVVLWSWNGTPYYNSLVPTGETFDVTAYYVDQTGKGGYIAAGIQDAITCINNNEDVLLVSFNKKQTRFVYTGDDLFPFLFFLINSELGASSTFSGITLDRGGVTVGRRGIVLTDQQSSQRIDLDFPDSVFQIQNNNNGEKRVNSVRDYYREWIYFSYPTNNSSVIYPTQTFLWNYRDDTWAILYENFTAHGNYRQQNKNNWKTIGQKFKTWSQWREPWNSGSTSVLFPSIVAGNPQGYVLIKGQGTGEGASGTILGIINNGGNAKINSINHCVSANNPNTGNGDYLFFSGAISTTQTVITAISQANPAVITTTNTFVAGQYVYVTEVAGMTQINGRFVEILSATGSEITINLDTTGYSAYTSAGVCTFSPLQNQIGKVISVQDANNFTVDIPYPSGTYTGLGQYTRLCQPLLQTKQFPVYWEQGRQVRLSAQKYLMDTTANGQVTVNIYLSQDPDDAWNNPMLNTGNLIYSQLMYTCPESANIGLSSSNTNLQMPTAESQFQIWHRFNTSLIGDTFQIGMTLSDAQMRDYNLATSEIVLHGIALSVEKGPHLA